MNAAVMNGRRSGDPSRVPARSLSRPNRSATVLASRSLINPAIGNGSTWAGLAVGQ